jgi:hypothetical protein
MARQVTPGFGGAVSDAIEAVKGYVAAGNRERENDTGNAQEDAQLHDEDSSHSSTVPSNAGRAAQSTDASNQY